MTTKLILIRHGLTDWNFKKRYCGFKDVELNDKGRKQAKSLYQRLKKEKIDRVYSSNRKRAIQTAKIIFKGLSIEKIPELKEINFGILEGLTHSEIMKKYPKIYKKWLDNPFSVTIPGGEDLYDFRKRIICAFKKIISENHHKTIAIVTHGGSIGIYITAILKSKCFWKKIPVSASISIIEHKNGKAKIRLFNDSSHLL